MLTCYERILAIAANWAAILTAVIALWASLFYVWQRRQKRLRLEDHLRTEKADGDQGQRGLQHLVAHVGMSEGDILDAAFRSKCIRCVTDKDEYGFATKVMLEYICD